MWAPDQAGPEGAVVLKAAGGDGGGNKGKEVLSGDRMKWEAPEVTQQRAEAKQKKKIKMLTMRKEKSGKNLASAEKTVQFTQGQLKSKRESVGNVSKQIAEQKAILDEANCGKEKGQDYQRR